MSWTLDDVRRGHRLPKENTDFSEYPSFRPAPEYHIDGPTTDSRVLIYNRVPKCASSTVQTLLDLLALRNGFKFKSLPLLTPGKAFTETEEREFVRNVTRFGGGAVDGHFYFVDFNKHGSSAKPIWINVVRDPVERAASMFKYLRREERWPRGAEKPPEVIELTMLYFPDFFCEMTSCVPFQSWFSKDFSQCVLSGDPECLLSSPEFLSEHQVINCPNNLISPKNKIPFVSSPTSVAPPPSASWAVPPPH